MEFAVSLILWGPPIFRYGLLTAGNVIPAILTPVTWALDSLALPLVSGNPRSSVHLYSHFVRAVPLRYIMRRGTDLLRGRSGRSRGVCDGLCLRGAKAQRSGNTQKS